MGVIDLRVTTQSYGQFEVPPMSRPVFQFILGDAIPLFIINTGVSHFSFK